MKESPRQHAFTLVEILFVLSMMGVAFLLEAQLFQISVRTVAAAPAAMNQQTSLERMAQPRLIRRAIARRRWSTAHGPYPTIARV